MFGWPDRRFEETQPVTNLPLKEGLAPDAKEQTRGVYEKDTGS
jgi:hypothetical protein